MRFSALIEASSVGDNSQEQDLLEALISLDEPQDLLVPKEGLVWLIIWEEDHCSLLSYLNQADYGNYLGYVKLIDHALMVTKKQNCSSSLHH